jgi:hypothetical protein
MADNPEATDPSRFVHHRQCVIREEFVTGNAIGLLLPFHKKLPEPRPDPE